MKDDTVLYEAHDGIALITLNRPERLNAIVGGMGERYTDLLRAADADPDVRAVVVTGAGRGFCSGADLTMLAEGSNALNSYLAGQSADSLPTYALRIGTPVVTAVNGPCAGIGFVLAISADARFASRTATFSSTFARLGLIAEYASAWLLTRLVGLGRATDLLLTGRTLTADEALAIGLVNDVADDALVAAMEWARAVADLSSPSSTAVIKAQLLAVDRESLDEALASSLEHMRAAFNRPDLGEAIAARLEKRPPQFPSRAS
ncbi:MAG: enoyl-CoA hydratase-related protein [Actinomycetota bacterium]|nr:enoyl-CoA hydratase-related protein [Actinomycetota bacterium]